MYNEPIIKTISNMFDGRGIPGVLVLLKLQLKNMKIWRCILDGNK
jgi:hypothetical protein